MPKRASLFPQGEKPGLFQDTGQNADRRLEEAKALLRIIEREHSGHWKLSPRDQEFLHDIAAKIKAYGRGAQVTGKQLFYLRDIRDKLL